MQLISRYSKLHAAFDGGRGEARRVSIKKQLHTASKRPFTESQMRSRRLDKRCRQANDNWTPLSGEAPEINGEIKDHGTGERRSNHLIAE